MKKLSLALACSTLLVAPTAFASSYVTGNAQMHSTNAHGSSMTSTLEAGHTFSTGTTVLVEFDGIQIGELRANDGNQAINSDLEVATQNSPTYVTLGLEQSFAINDNLWVAAGYHHLLANGEVVQYRPLVKIGYNFDNGLSLSNRTRVHFAEADNVTTDVRLDTKIAYALNSDVALAYNNVYMVKRADGADDAVDHELRATWTRNGVQPYIEYRSQGNTDGWVDSNANHALVIGASYGF